MSWKTLKSNVTAKYKASADARKAYTDELRTARVREAKIYANQRAILERKQKLSRLARRPQTISRALGLTRSIGVRARGGAGRTLGIYGRPAHSKPRKGQFGYKKKNKKRRNYGRNYDDGFNNGYDSGFGGGFGFG